MNFLQKTRNWLQKVWNALTGTNTKATIKHPPESIGEEIHKIWPAIAFLSPSPYHRLSEREKASIAQINSDFCIINHDTQIDRFIRVVLKQKVNKVSHTLDYGLWVSLSEESFENYKENYNNDSHETQYFGWLSNDLPRYGITMNIPMTVVTKSGNDRPEIYPHKNFHHPFVKDYYQGISKDKAEQIIHEMLGKI